MTNEGEKTRFESTGFLFSCRGFIPVFFWIDFFNLITAGSAVLRIPRSCRQSEQICVHMYIDKLDKCICNTFTCAPRACIIRVFTPQKTTYAPSQKNFKIYMYVWPHAYRAVVLMACCHFLNGGFATPWIWLAHLFQASVVQWCPLSLPPCLAMALAGLPDCSPKAWKSTRL